MYLFYIYIQRLYPHTTQSAVEFPPPSRGEVRLSHCGQKATLSSVGAKFRANSLDNARRGEYLRNHGQSRPRARCAMGLPKTTHAISIRLPLGVYDTILAEVAATRTPAYRLILNALHEKFPPKEEPLPPIPGAKYNPFTRG